MFYIPSLGNGNAVLIYKNYKFWLNNRLKNGLSWACSERRKFGCRCKVLTTPKGRFLALQSEHNHSSQWYGSLLTSKRTDHEYIEYTRMLACKQLY